MNPILYPDQVSTKRWEYIRDGGSFVFQVASVQEAIALAKKLKDDGIRDLFRGQTNSKWKVTSSFERQPLELTTEAEQTIGRFVGWAKSHPKMIPYLADEDSLIAIAQHYGLATPFIDFTSDPEVAAFFALDSQQEPEEGQYASIICLKEAEFSHFWTQHADVICGVTNARSPEIIHINVDNLWRLQAQKGCFLWASVRDQESWYDFDRIIFPFDKSHIIKYTRNDIYPENQSALELDIAHFFMNERMSQSMAFFKELARSAQLPIGKIEGSHEARSWYSAGWPRTSDWNHSDQWRKGDSEHVDIALSSPPIIFSHTSSSIEFSGNLLNIINEDYIAQNRIHGLMFSWEGHSPEDLEVLRLASCIRLLWNGIRRLPFSNAEVQAALQGAVRMFFSKEYKQSMFRVTNFEDEKSTPVYVEFSASEDGKGSYSRAYVTREGLARALSPHFIAAVSEVHGSFPEQMEDVLLIPARPWERFTFEGLCYMMITEIIPSQAILYGGVDPVESLHRAFFFSPADLKIFGLV